ncbi:MAG: hypothetical protein PHX34_00710 [Candidatus Shapirobacteria bacterium]|nr:hypothetical protein [Candidatus Shapirobacteria bacterium]
MDITQIAIIASLTCITIIIVVAGIWLVLILKELKLTLHKADRILDDTKTITNAVAQPMASISEFVDGFKNGVSFFNSLFKKKK